MYSTHQQVYNHPILPFKRILHNIIYNYHFSSWIMTIQLLWNINQAYQIWVSNKSNSIFGELFRSKFMVLHDNWLKNIGDEFF